MAVAIPSIIILAVALLTSEPLPATRWLVQAAAAGVLGVSGLALFFLALSLGKMSVVAPITSCGAAIPAIVSSARLRTVPAAASACRLTSGPPYLTAIWPIVLYWPAWVSAVLRRWVTSVWPRATNTLPESQA